MRWLLSVACCVLCGCSLATGKSGASCERSTQCAPGLACVSGKCGKDLSAIAATNTVPMLGAGTGAARGGSGGAGAYEAAGSGG